MTLIGASTKHRRGAPNERQMPRPKRLNRKDITPEVLRTFKGFENVTQEEAEEICSITIHLCCLAYEAHIDHKKTERDERLEIEIPEIHKERP